MLLTKLAGPAPLIGISKSGARLDLQFLNILVVFAKRRLGEILAMHLDTASVKAPGYHPFYSCIPIVRERIGEAAAQAKKENRQWKECERYHFSFSSSFK